MTIDEAMAALKEADEELEGFPKLSRRQEILNEVSDTAFRRGQESTLPF